MSMTGHRCAEIWVRQRHVNLIQKHVPRAIVPKRIILLAILKIAKDAARVQAACMLSDAEMGTAGGAADIGMTRGWRAGLSMRRRRVAGMEGKSRRRTIRRTLLRSVLTLGLDELLSHLGGGGRSDAMKAVNLVRQFVRDMAVEDFGLHGPEARAGEPSV